MKMIFRWFGEHDDSISLKEIAQIPQVEGIAGFLSDIPAGAVWPKQRIHKLKKRVNEHKLRLEVIESVNIHESIKLGSENRDQYIENYIQTIKNLSKFGIKVICYNFMPVFDWLRSDLQEELADGSRVMSYDGKKVDRVNPLYLIEEYEEGAQGFSLPGWEPERLNELENLLEKYKVVDEEQLFVNLKYFLQKIIPVCEQENVKMAIHPADPPWDVFGIPRIAVGKQNLQRIINLVDSEYNGLTLCSGSLGANPENNIPEMIHYFGSRKRIHFAHIRNLKYTGPEKFVETAHPSSEGDLDIYEIMKAYHDIDFQGYVRPDHGRMIWGEQGRPGYGLYDRALGAAYLSGLWEAICKNNK